MTRRTSDSQCQPDTGGELSGTFVPNSSPAWPPDSTTTTTTTSRALPRLGDAGSAPNMAASVVDDAPAFARSQYGRVPAAERAAALERAPTCPYTGTSPSSQVNHISAFRRDWGGSEGRARDRRALGSAGPSVSRRAPAGRPEFGVSAERPPGASPPEWDVRRRLRGPRPSESEGRGRTSRTSPSSPCRTGTWPARGSPSRASGWRTGWPG
jgi:hypothetical protein